MSIELANRLSRRWIEDFQAGENTVVCGPGAWALLTVLLSGAAGKAERELSDTVGLSRAEAAAGFDELASVIERVPDLALASGIWARPGITVFDSFAAPLGDLTVAELPDSPEPLDQWTATATDGMITSFPAPVTPESRLVAATAMAANLEWVYPFVADAGSWWDGAHRDHTRLSRSTTSVDDAAIVDGDTPISRLTCATTADVDVVLVAGDVNASPAAVLTTAFDALTDGARVTSGSALDVGAAAGALMVTEVPSSSPNPEPELEVTVPAFEVTTTHDLMDDADRFGLATASDARTGHFPHLADEPLAIEAAAQSAMASFSERGFRAAATTAMTAIAGSVPAHTRRIIRVDHAHPFGFLAVDRRSGLVTFAGWVHDVNPMEELTALSQSWPDGSSRDGVGARWRRWRGGRRRRARGASGRLDQGLGAALDRGVVDGPVE